jgi:uncharacterized protein YcsI (UPF0317 family)
MNGPLTGGPSPFKLPSVSFDTPAQLREAIRRDEWDRPTAGLVPEFTQANLVVLPEADAFAFLRFCVRNPRPCPVLEVLDPGAREPAALAPHADLRTDVPRYRVYRDGELVEEPSDVRAHWREDLVAFLIGCSFTFERAMLGAGLPVRHAEQGVNVPMYRTNRECLPAGRFRGPLVVSMRPMTPAQAAEAVVVTSRFPAVHGAPLHAGDPEALGIEDLAKPDYGDPVEIRTGEIPVFWACGVTSQAVAVASRPELMLTHAPGHMFVTDVPDGAYDTSASGLTGEPVPPRTFSGVQTNANSRTPWAASPSRFSDSTM